MFDKPTVILTGAGASCHYGYPTGEALIQLCLEKTQEIKNMCKELHKGAYFNLRQSPRLIPSYWHNNFDSDFTISNFTKSIEEKCDLFSQKIISHDPIVIDYFLEWNESISDFAKIIIAWVILDKEREGKNKSDENWVKHITAKILEGVSSNKRILQNNVTFVTFNYDISLERNLYSALISCDVVPEEDVHKFFEERFFHIYGSVGDHYRDDLPLLSRKNIEANTEKYNLEFRKIAKFLIEFEYAYQSSRSIETINPKERADLKKARIKAKQYIEECETLYVLGYGFNKDNNERIGLNNILKANKNRTTKIYITNFKNSNNINRNAEDCFTGQTGKFFLNSPDIHSGLFGGKSFVIERSVRTVFEAFKWDLPL